MIPYKLLNFSASKLCQRGCYPSIHGLSEPPRGHVPVRLLDVTDISKRKLIPERFRSPFEFGFVAKIAFPQPIRTSVVRTRFGLHLKNRNVLFFTQNDDQTYTLHIRAAPFLLDFSKVQLTTLFSL